MVASPGDRISLGRIVGAEGCRLEPRLRACLVMDAPMPADVVQSGIQQPFSVSAAETYLATIVLAAAFSRRGPARLSSWAENVITARRAHRAGALTLHAAGEREDPVTMAVHAARKINIRCHSDVLDRTLDVAASLGFGYLTSVTVEGWGSLAVSALTTSVSAFVLQGREPSRQAIARLSQRPGPLRHLAEAGPGRLHRRWGQPGQL